MLLRPDPDGVLCVTQPAHAWVSGQIARQWGNDHFPTPSPELCFAAEQHDLGFLDWERAPTLDPETGWPHTFLNLPDETHLQIWNAGVQHLLRFGRYPALLVSLHFSEIGRQSRADGTDKCGLEPFLREQETLQRSLVTSLRNDAFYGPGLSDERLENDRQFVALMDWMSLLICTAFREPKLHPDKARSYAGHIFHLEPTSGSASHIRLDPWPFRQDKLQLVWEARRLLQRWGDVLEMREALRAAARLTLVAELTPA